MAAADSLGAKDAPAHKQDNGSCASVTGICQYASCVSLPLEQVVRNIASGLVELPLSAFGLDVFHIC